MHWSVTRAPVGAFVPHIIFVALLAPLVDGYMVGPEGCGTTKPIKIADDTVTDISDLEDDSRCVFTKNPEAIQKHMDEAAKGVAGET